MMKISVLLLLIVHVFGKNPARDDPYPGHIKEKIIYNPSIPISRSGGATVLKPNDVRIAKIVKVLIDSINSHVDEGDKLEVQKTGKVELKVIDDRQRMPYEPHRFIKNIYTLEKIMCISRDRHTEVNIHGSLSLIYNQQENLVGNEAFVNYVFRNSPVPYEETVRRKSIPGDIDDEEKKGNRQRRHSLKMEMDRHWNRRMNN